MNSLTLYLSRIKELAGKATPKFETIIHDTYCDNWEVSLLQNFDEGQAQRNAAFIAESRTIVPKLVEIVELQARLITLTNKQYCTKEELIEESAIRSQIEDLIK